MITTILLSISILIYAVWIPFLWKGYKKDKKQEKEIKQKIDNIKGV